MGVTKRKENAQSRPGLSQNMMQGGTGRKGDAAEAGKVREVMHQGKTKNYDAPKGKLRQTMHQ